MMLYTEPEGMKNFSNAFKYACISEHAFQKMRRTGELSEGVRIPGHYGKFWTVEELDAVKKRMKSLQDKVKRMLTVKDLADMLHYSPSEVARYIRNGELRTLMFKGVHYCSVKEAERFARKAGIEYEEL